MVPTYPLQSPTFLPTSSVVNMVPNTSLRSSVVMNGNYVPQQLGAPQPHSWVENVPIQKYYTDYEPVVTHE